MVPQIFYKRQLNVMLYCTVVLTCTYEVMMQVKHYRVRGRQWSQNGIWKTEDK